MKEFLILGAGTAGSMLANRMTQKLSDEWNITIVDQCEKHYYQPGFLFLPFHMYQPDQVQRNGSSLLNRRANLIHSKIDLIEPAQQKVRLANGQTLPYDYLVVATGVNIYPEETPGMNDNGWMKNIHSLYTFENALALRSTLDDWQGGHLVVSITKMPLKCPVASMEFAFLADSWYTQKGMRSKVDITYVTPLPGVFSKPYASSVLKGFYDQKHINIVTNFETSEVDNTRQVIRSQNGQEVNYDLLVTVPVNKGATMLAESGLGDANRLVPVDMYTLQSTQWPNIWAIGDTGNLPSPKAGSVAHYQMEDVIHNILDHMQGKPMTHHFDGHANCYLESGYNQAIMMDFSYTDESWAGTYPLPLAGPFTLLKPTWINHLGKLIFKWMYWNLLIPGRKMPIPDKFSLLGKQVPKIKPAGQ